MRKLIKFSFLPLSAILAIIVVMLRPLVIFRFCLLPDARIGHFIQDVTIYLSQKKNLKNSEIDFFCFSHKSNLANQFILKKWKKKLNIMPAYILIPLLKILNFLYYFIPLENKHKIPLTSFDNTNSVLKNEKLIKLSKKEISKGKRTLLKMGVPSGRKFVVLIIRDEKYLKKTKPLNDWSYHNYRNLDLNKFLKLVNYLISKNYFVIRVGKIVKNKFPIKNKMFIDYPFSKYRSDFMDYYLTSNAYFAVTTLTGLDSVSYVNKVPILGIQHPLCDLEIINRCKLIILSKFYSKKTRKILSISQTINLLKNNDNEYSKILNKKKFTLIKNTDKEILDAGKDMINYIEKKMIYKKSQKKFWSQILNYINDREKTNLKLSIVKTQISQSFFKKNSKILVN